MQSDNEIRNQLVTEVGQDYLAYIVLKKSRGAFRTRRLTTKLVSELDQQNGLYDRGKSDT